MPVRVVDTDVWSYLYKGRDEAKLYEPHLFGNVLVISFQTRAELLQGAMAAGWGEQRRQHLESRLQRYVVNIRRMRYVCAGRKRSSVPVAPGDQSRRRTPGSPQLLCILAYLSSRITEAISSAFKD